jgi:hypothetical protein
MIAGLLADVHYAPHLEEQYMQRLRYGLSQYYSRRYRPLEVANQIRSPEEE